MKGGKTRRRVPRAYWAALIVVTTVVLGWYHYWRGLPLREALVVGSIDIIGVGVLIVVAWRIGSRRA